MPSKKTHFILHVSFFVEEFENVQWILALVRLRTSDICILSILPRPPILCPPPGLYPYLTRVQWTVLPWEWDAARMMATITVPQHTYLIRHNSIWQLKVQRQAFRGLDKSYSLKLEWWSQSLSTAPHIFDTTERNLSSRHSFENRPLWGAKSTMGIERLASIYKMNCTSSSDKSCMKVLV